MSREFQNQAGSPHYEDLLHEFEVLKERNELYLPLHTDGVVVLGAKPIIIENIVRSSEQAVNRKRIGFAINIVQAIHSLVPESKAPLIISAYGEELEDLTEYVISSGVSRGNVIGISCGKLWEGNTLTNIQTVGAYAREANVQHLTFVSSLYHAPRVARSASAHLPEHVEYDVLHLRFKDHQIDQSDIDSEIARIQTYIAKGDIAVFPRSYPQ